MTNIDPDMSRVMSWQKFIESEYANPDDKEIGPEYYERARKYIESYDFCAGIKEAYVAMLYPGIIAMYLFKIENRSTFGEWVWVIVGDIPPAVFSPSVGRTPGMVLDAYLGEMDVWVEAVNEGKPVDKLIPVNAPPTKEYADMLLGRLEFIGERILMEEYKDDLDYLSDEEG
jgi:hypothetical protein